MIVIDFWDLLFIVVLIVFGIIVGVSYIYEWIVSKSEKKEK